MSEKPEGISDWEWDLYKEDDPTRHAALRSKYPHLRDTIADAFTEVRNLGHVPEENLDRYRRLMGISRKLKSLGNEVSGLGDYGGANALWGISARYRDKAQELRVDIPPIHEPDGSE
jgi:hypothetical protein